MSLDALKSFFSEDNNQDIGKDKEVTKERPDLILTAHIEREKKSRELYKEMAKNIKESERLRSKINKDFKAGADPVEILKDSIKCISLMTGDTVFYKQNIKYLE